MSPLHRMYGAIQAQSTPILKRFKLESTRTQTFNADISQELNINSLTLSLDTYLGPNTTTSCFDNFAETFPIYDIIVTIAELTFLKNVCAHIFVVK